jgi:hypothetical protein
MRMNNMTRVPFLRWLHCVAVSIAASAMAGTAGAQTSGWQSVISVSPVVFEEADLDPGGSFSVGGAIMRAGMSTGFGDGHRGGLTFNFDYFDWSFSNPVAFGGVAPWDVLKRYGATAPFTFALRDGWSVGVAPSVDWFREDGASTSDALVWGATFSAVKRFDDGNVLGLGLAAFDGIEETRLFPFPIVNWRFSPRWTLTNPLAAGPSGPTGLELDRRFDNQWIAGLGTAFRRVRYRLSEGGPVASGISEIRGVPIYLRVRREFAQTYVLNLYAGVVTGGELRVENANGNLLRKSEVGSSPIAGINITARF